MKDEVILLILGTSSIFWSMHLSGSCGLPRRVPDTPDTYLSLSLASYLPFYIEEMMMLHYYLVSPQIGREKVPSLGELPRKTMISTCAVEYIATWSI